MPPIAPSPVSLIQEGLSNLTEMSKRFDRKHSRYKWWTYTLRWVVGLCGVLTTLRDPITRHLSMDWPFSNLIFPAIGATTALVTLITGQFRWAERMSVALSLKLECDSGYSDVRAEWAADPDKPGPVLNRLNGILAAVRKKAADSGIDWR